MNAKCQAAVSLTLIAFTFIRVHSRLSKNHSINR